VSILISPRDTCIRGTPGRERDLLLRVSETQMEFTRHGIFRNAARRTSINIARAVASIRAGNVSPRQEKTVRFSEISFSSLGNVNQKEREREREREERLPITQQCKSRRESICFSGFPLFDRRERVSRASICYKALAIHFVTFEVRRIRAVRFFQ
jgi:hypothetical protein